MNFHGRGDHLLVRARQLDLRHRVVVIVVIVVVAVDVVVAFPFDEFHDFRLQTKHDGLLVVADIDADIQCQADRQFRGAARRHQRRAGALVAHVDAGRVIFFKVVKLVALADARRAVVHHRHAGDAQTDGGGFGLDHADDRFENTVADDAAQDDIPFAGFRVDFTEFRQRADGLHGFRAEAVRERRNRQGTAVRRQLLVHLDADVPQVVFIDRDETRLDRHLQRRLVEFFDELFRETEVFTRVTDHQDIAVTEDAETRAFGAVRQEGRQHVLQIRILHGGHVSAAATGARSAAAALRDFRNEALRKTDDARLQFRTAARLAFRHPHHVLADIEGDAHVARDIREQFFNWNILEFNRQRLLRLQRVVRDDVQAVGVQFFNQLRDIRALQAQADLLVDQILLRAFRQLDGAQILVDQNSRAVGGRQRQLLVRLLHHVRTRVFAVDGVRVAAAENLHRPFHGRDFRLAEFKTLQRLQFAQGLFVFLLVDEPLDFVQTTAHGRLQFTLFVPFDGGQRLLFRIERLQFRDVTVLRRAARRQEDATQNQCAWKDYSHV